jgi:hydrogenase expression/formation protein HypC
MCLGIPMKITQIDNWVAQCEAKGVFRDVSLFLLQDTPLEPGDYVLVHVGYALQKITEAHARTTWELLDEVLSCSSEPEPDYA